MGLLGRLRSGHSAEEKYLRRMRDHDARQRILRRRAQQ
jgi:hypothetical protein